MRNQLNSSARAALAKMVAERGTIPVSAALDCSPTTLRRVLRGGLLNSGTRGLVSHYLSTEGEHAQRFAA